MQNAARPASVYSINGRWLRLACFAVITLLVSGIFCICVLMLATPSVRDAPMRVREFSAKHRAVYPAAQPPTRFTASLVATEDHRFYSALDMGVDPFALTRLVIAFAVDGKDAGGSSIDQQLAKMLYTPDRGGNFLVDLKQVILAMKIHLFYSNKEIM